MNNKRRDRLEAEAAIPTKQIEVNPLDPRLRGFVEAFADANDGVVDPGLIVMMIPEDSPLRPTQAQVALFAEQSGFRTERLDHNVAHLAPPKVRANILNASVELEAQLVGVRAHVERLRSTVSALEARVSELQDDEAASMASHDEYTGKNEALKVENTQFEQSLAERRAALEAEGRATREAATAEAARITAQAQGLKAEAEAAAARLTAQSAELLATSQAQAQGIRAEAEIAAENAKSEASSEAERIVTEAQTQAKTLAQDILAEAQSRSTNAARAGQNESERIIQSARSEADRIIATAQSHAQAQIAETIARERQQLQAEVAELEAVLSCHKATVARGENQLSALKGSIAKAQQELAELKAQVEKLEGAEQTLEQAIAEKNAKLTRREALLARAIQAFELSKKRAPEAVAQYREIRRKHKERMAQMQAEIEDSKREAKLHMPRVKRIMACAIALVLISAYILWRKYQ
jgi:chromosome segregation ATPase